jgi:hypothetical protein
MTQGQKDSLFGILDYFGCFKGTITEIHHGDCVGADEEFDNTVVTTLKQDTVIRVIHPPVDTEHQANMAAKNNGFYKETIISVPQTHLKRNRNVVEATDILIATPEQESDPGWGGTWYTYNHARKHDKPTYLIQPSGNVIAHDNESCRADFPGARIERPV